VREIGQPDDSASRAQQADGPATAPPPGCRREQQNRVELDRHRRSKQRAGRRPAEVTTDRAAAYPRVLDELLPAAHHVDARYANNKVEVDHGRLKARLRPMRGLKRLRSAQVIGSGHAFVQNSAAATTNSASTPNPIADSQQCSPNSPWLSDAMKGRGLRSLVTAPG